MAATVGYKHGPNPVTYEPLTGKVSVVRRYHVTETDPEAALALLKPSALPDAVVPTNHPITLPDTGETVVYVTPVEYQLKRPGKTSYSVVTITSEGYKPGAMRWQPVMGTTMRTQKWSYNETGVGDAAIREGIGPNGQGLPRKFPTFDVRVTYNVPAYDPAWHGRYPLTPEIYSAICQALEGSVNEASWAPDIFPDPDTVNTDYGSAWPEGAWLYMGATPDYQRDGTVIFEHTFNYDVEVFAHRSVWRHGKFKFSNQPVDGTNVFRVNTVYQGDAVAIHSQVYPIAGTETASMPTLIENMFRDLGNPRSGAYKFEDLMLWTL